MASAPSLARTWSPQGMRSGTMPKFALLVALWGACGVAVHLQRGQLGEVGVQALVAFYQPVFLILSMLWLWISAVWFFETRTARYEACFAAEHLKYLLSARAIAEIASGFTTVAAVSAAAYVTCCARGQFTLASYQPALMYVGVIAMLVNPLDMTSEETYGPQRWFFLDTLRRVLLPFQMVAFSDFLLADILTSLSKPLSDLGLVACRFVSSRSLAARLMGDPNKAHQETCTGSHVIVPLLLALPYVLRFVQCVIVWRSQGDTGQFYNAIKYSTALPVIYLAFLQTPWEAGPWPPLWVAAAALNTSYSFYWDVERDWDIRMFHRGPKGHWLKNEVRMFRSDAPYFALIATNFVLRFSWLYKLSAALLSLRAVVFTMALLEIVRRWLWAFVRLENELRKVQSRQPALTPLIPANPKRKASEYSFAAETEMAAVPAWQQQQS